MKWISLALAVMAAAAGVVASWRWYLSSQVPIAPGWRLPGTSNPIQPTDPSAEAIGWAIAIRQQAEETAELNRKAAFWTAYCILLSTAAAVTGAWPA